MIHVSEDQQDGVRWRVVRLEEFLDVIERGGVEVVEVPIKIVRIRPVAVGDGRQIEPRKSAVGLIEDVDAHFFLHDVALVAQILIVHLEGAHAVRFQPEHAFEGIRRDRFVVVRDVVMRRAIEHAAGGIDQLDVHHFAGVGRALKHHVLEQVRETAAAARLDAKTDVVVDAHRGHRRRVVRRNDHAQAVGQRHALDWNVQLSQEVPLESDWRTILRTLAIHPAADFVLGFFLSATA